MWPWGHLAVGYLLYAGIALVRDRSSPRGAAVVALAVGTQFPDLVDKPLAYWTALLPEGRTLAHSLVIALPLSAGVWLLARRDDRLRAAGGGFVLGHLSHLAGDAVVPLLRGEIDELGFLLWPLLPAPDYEAAGFVHHWRRLTESPVATTGGAVQALAEPFVVQLWLFGIAVVLWIAHGAPPLAQLLAWRTRYREPPR